MGLLNKLLTAVRGVAHEAGEAIVDEQGVRILEQEIRDSKENMNKAKTSLTAVMAESMAANRKVTALENEIKEYEGYVAAALNKGDEGLAMEAAEKLAELETEFNTQKTVAESFSSQVTQLKSTIKETEKQIEAMERQVNVVKTTESVQKAAEATASSFSGTTSSLNNAASSLERIKARQQKRQDQMAAASELAKDSSGEDLKSRLASAGITQSSNSASSVLERIRKQQQGE